MKILFVCLGNICRSPLAEAIFNKKIIELGLRHKFQSDSCGTGNYNIGDDPDPRAIRCAHKNNIPIVHKARQFKRADADFFDLILTMDDYNLKDIMTTTHFSSHAKVKLLRDYDPKGPGHVPDPYYGKEDNFDEVFQLLNRSIDGLIKELLQNS
jgi:protein-tyrosine phosphatase